MVRWKLFGRYKSKEEKPESEEPIQEKPKEIMQSDTEQESEETISTETEQEPEKPTLVEHHETLYTKGTIPKKETINQTTWRDVNAIEENVDNLRMSKSKKPVSELDKKVDKILSKRKKK